MFLCSNIIHDYIGINEIIYPKVTHEHVTVRYFLGYHTPLIISYIKHVLAVKQ